MALSNFTTTEVFVDNFGHSTMKMVAFSNSNTIGVFVKKILAPNYKIGALSNLTTTEFFFDNIGNQLQKWWYFPISLLERSL